MTYQVKVDQDLIPSFRHLPPEIKRAVKEALRKISQNPYLGKELGDDLSGFYSFRIRSLRLVYSVFPSKRVIKIIAMGPRASIYEELGNKLLVKRIMEPLDE